MSNVKNIDHLHYTFEICQNKIKTSLGMNFEKAKHTHLISLKNHTTEDVYIWTVNCTDSRKWPPYPHSPVSCCVHKHTKRSVSQQTASLCRAAGLQGQTAWTDSTAPGHRVHHHMRYAAGYSWRQQKYKFKAQQQRWMGHQGVKTLEPPLELMHSSMTPPPSMTSII